MLFTTKGHLLPYLSAAIPKMIEPTERNMSTRVIPHVICALLLRKSLARSETVRETVKKSKASHDHAKKPTWTCNWQSSLGGVQGYNTYQEEQPLLPVEHGKQFEWVGDLGHGWLQGRNARDNILLNRHILVVHSSATACSRLIRSHFIVVRCHFDRSPVSDDVGSQR